MISMNKKVVLKIILLYIVGAVFAQIGINLNNNKSNYAFIIVIISGIFTVTADFYWRNNVSHNNTYLRLFLLFIIVCGIIGFTGMSLIYFLSNNIGILDVTNYEEMVV